MSIAYTVRSSSRQQVDYLIKMHYLHKWPGVVVLTLGLYDPPSSSPIGAIVYALPPRETSARYRVGVCWELARLFILDCTPKNTESWFISRSVKYIRENRPDVQLLVSYADPSHGHTGTIYLASNWISDGMTDQDRKTPRFDYSVDGKVYSRRSHVPVGSKIERVPRVSKFRFVFWVHGNERKRAEALNALR